MSNTLEEDDRLLLNRQRNKLKSHRKYLHLKLLNILKARNCFPSKKFLTIFCLIISTFILINVYRKEDTVYLTGKFTI